MWMLWFVPDDWLLMLVNGILILGTVLTFLSFFVINRILRFFPPLAAWHTVLQVISVVILTAGVYFKGSYETEAEWRAKVAEVQAKVEAAKKESEDLNRRLDEERKKKQKVRVEYYNTVKTELREVEVQKVINGECKVDPKANEILNKAAQNPNEGKK